MSILTTIEPTPHQLARIATIEVRTKAVLAELDDLTREVQALEQEGLETRGLEDSLGLDAPKLVLDYLRILRVSHGIKAFSDWWNYRVDGLDGVSYLAEQVDSDDLPRYRALIAVEQAMSEADGELIGILNRGHGLGHASDADKLTAEIGMTKAALEDRAEAVLTTLIESGWRP
jgi:hypothetical protein